MKIFSKLLGLVGITVVCLVGALCLVSFLLIADFGNDAAHKNLSTVSRTMQGIIEDKLVRTAAVGALASHDGALAKAVAERDLAALNVLAKKYNAISIIDQVTICDADRKVLARGHSDSVGDVLEDSRISVVRALAEKKAVTSIEQGKLVRLSMASATPVLYEGEVVGVVVLGENLSSGTFVQQIKEMMDVECTIFLGDMRVATTVRRDGKPVVDTLLNNAEIYSAVVDGNETVMTRNVIAGSEYDTVYWPWKGFSGKNEGMFFVGISRAEVIQQQTAVVLTFIVAGVVLGALLIVAGAFVARAIVRPLKAATAYAEDVAGGRLDSSLDVVSKDEVGVLSNSLRHMVSNLKEKIAESEAKEREAEAQAEKAAVAMEDAKQAQAAAEAGQQALFTVAGEVQAVVESLTGATDSLAAQVEQSAATTVSQREQVASSASSMEEMSASVFGVARSAAGASEASERAKEKAQSGHEIVNQSVSAIETVRNDVLLLKQNMEELGGQAQSIGAIMTVISDIADQTNLLALNAAIEAARAGDAGRGFAVVADEVRKLAEKTMEATQEVGSAIAGIQQGTQRSVDAVERTTENIEQTTVLVNQSGEALEEIVEESVKTADQVRTIATAAEEQSSVSEEIARSLDGINQSAVETASAMDYSSRSVSDLSVQTRQLQDLVNKLRE